MRVAQILLLISLLAVGLYSQAPPSARAQKPDTVTIRPRSTNSQPGIPEVKAVADRTRIPVGDEVTFTLSPASVFKDPCYQVTLFFGDKDSQIMRQPQTVHAYQSGGNYTYSILVRPVAGCGATQTQTPTPFPIPAVRLILKPSSVDVNETVTFIAEPSQPAKGLVFRFVFDDGSETGWQNDPKASHAYAASKTYRPYVEMRFAAGLAARPVVGSRRQPVEVRPQSITIDVKLSANPRAADERTPITFTAQATASRPIRMQYRFDFGDQSAIKWQSTPQATHRYKPGSYTARVEAAPLIPAAAQRSASDSVTIEIAPTDKATVSLNVEPATAPQGIPVFFRAIARGADSQTSYRFHFGDNRTSDWSPQPTQTHAYAAPRDYQASVEMRTSDGTVVSANKQITIIPIIPPTPTPTTSPTPPGSPTPTPTGSTSPTPAGSTSPTPTGSTTPTPAGSTSPANASPTATATQPVSGRTWPPDWWPLPLIILLALAGYKAAKYFLAPRPNFVPHPMAGDAKASGLAFDYQVDVDPNVDGAFNIDAAGGNLIKAKRTSDD